MSEIKKSPLFASKRELLLSTTHTHCLALARSASKFHAVIQGGGCPRYRYPTPRWVAPCTQEISGITCD